MYRPYRLHSELCLCYEALDLGVIMRFYPKLHYSAIFFAAIGLSILTLQSAQAHPADMYFQTHTIRLTPDGIRLTWSIYPGPLLVPLVYGAVDQDRNDVINPDAKG